METEPKARSLHRKRRERAQRLQLEQTDTDGEQEGDERSPSGGPRERSRSKPRKKKNSSGTYEEDIIDGFAIVSFKSIEDLEKYTAGKLSSNKKVSADTKCNKRNSSLSPARPKQRNHVKKKEKQTPNNIPKPRKHNNSAADNSESSGETTDNLDTSDLVLNGPKKTLTRQLSDVSTRSSSGAGYLCDSESGDERVSDASLDIFTTKPVHHSNLCDTVITSSLPPVSSHSPTITTATSSITSTTSDVTVTTVTTTTCCVALATTLTTTSVTATTAIPSVHTNSSKSTVNNNNNSNSTNNNNTSNNNSNLYYHQQHQAHYNSQQQFQHHHQQNQQQQQHLQQQKHHHHHQQALPNHLKNHYHPQQAAVDKYSPRLNSQNHHSSQQVQQKSHSHEKRDIREVHPSPNSHSQSVIKRRPPTPPLTRASRSPSRSRPAPPPLSSVATASPLSVTSASTSSSVINRDIKRASPSLSRTPRRDDPRDPRDRDLYPVLPPSLAVSKSFFPPGFPGHGASTPNIYSPLGPSPGLHPLHSTPSHSTGAPYPGGAIPSLHQPLPAAPQTPQSHGMFAPPLPLAPPAPLAGSLPGAPPAHIQPESPLSIANPDILREELNRRFLASQERSPLLQSVPPFMRADIHQHMHQHQHQHQHMHQHTYHGNGIPPPPISASSLIPTPTPNMFDKQLPSNPFFRGSALPHRPGIAEPAPRVLPGSKDKPGLTPHPRTSIPGLAGYPSLLLNPTAPDALNSGIPGAFQPKQGLSSIHPSVGPLYIPGRELDKAGQLIPPAPPASNLPTQAKKAGKWCAVHVRIAWEIYNYQQKQPEKGSDSKPGTGDPLRPPSHLLPGSSLSRPQEMSGSGSSLLGTSRSMFDSSPHNLMSSASHIAPSFPRPSPYSISSSIGLGIGNGLNTSSRDAPPVASGSHEWNLLHRTPPTFPGHPWAKPEEREKEMERERERELRDASLDRRREEERDRERRLMEQDRHRYSVLEDHARERDRFRESELLNKSRSRSRSRSPMRNGRVDSAKSDRSFDRRPDENMLKVKEERRESLTREEELIAERDRLLKSEFLPSRTSDPYLQANLERARMMTPRTFFSGEHMPGHPSLWNPFDKAPVDFQNHRLSLPREIEAREHLFNRFQVPGLQHGIHSLAAMGQDRLKEEMLIREERAKRDYLERLPMLERERFFYDSKLPPALRPPDHVSLGHSFTRNISPALNHMKRSSPMVMPCAPPPLISGSSQGRGHSSPAVNKTKGVSPTDSVGESKRDSNSNSTDPDAHSR